MIPLIVNLRSWPANSATVRVDRRTPWGNPFVMRGKSEAERNRVCDAFEAWAMAPEQAEFRAAVRRELRGKDLACWCAPKRCHAETLRRIANELLVPLADICRCHDGECPHREECRRWIHRDTGRVHTATGRSGGNCDLEDFSDTLPPEIE